MENSSGYIDEGSESNIGITTHILTAACHMLLKR